jgi:hypothetical protein
VIESDVVAEGTRALNDDERQEFASRLKKIKQGLEACTDSVWISR